MAIQGEQLRANDDLETTELPLPEKLEITRPEATETQRIEPGVRTRTEIGIGPIELSSKTERFVDGFFAIQAEDVRREFDQVWLDDHPEQSDIPEGAINGPEYKEIRQKLDEIEGLRDDIKKAQVAPEVVFLVLNRLQKSPERGRGRELDSARVELAGRLLKENLTETAEKKFVAIQPDRGAWVKSQSNKRSAEARAKSNHELIDKELRMYESLDQNREEKFKERLDLRGVVLDGNRDVFQSAMAALSARNGIEGGQIFGLLSMGYRPYEPIKREGFLKKSVVVPKLAGDSERMSERKFDDLVKRAGEDYERSVQNKINMAIEKLNEEWEVFHDNFIRDYIEGRIARLVQSPDVAQARIEKQHADLREVVADDWIRLHLRGGNKN